MKSFRFPYILSGLVFILLACQAASPAYAVNDSTSSRRVQVIAEDFSYRSQGIHPPASFASLSPFTQGTVVNLRLKSYQSMRCMGYNTYRGRTLLLSGSPCLTHISVCRIIDKVSSY